ncbi:hypothetical protein BH11MYX1_BH11MYX1_28940 [soil metagenome]
MTKLALGSFILALAPNAPSLPAPSFRTTGSGRRAAPGPEAKAGMKTFMNDKKIKSCNQCHLKLERKADGRDQFTKAGGK